LPYHALPIKFLLGLRERAFYSGKIVIIRFAYLIYCLALTAFLAADFFFLQPDLRENSASLGPS